MNSMRDDKSVDIESTLKNVPLFEGLSEGEIARMARSTREIRLARGRLLFRKGDACNGLHLLFHGQVKLACTSAQGNEKVVEVVQSGQSLGEANLFMETPYSVFAEALVDSRVLHVAKEAIFQVLHCESRFACRMLTGMAMRQYRLMTDIEAYALHTGKQRVIGYLMGELEGSQRDSSNVVLNLPVKKGVIASRLSLTQEHFSRILHELADQGLIMVAGKSISIPSVPALNEHLPA